MVPSSLLPALLLSGLAPAEPLAQGQEPYGIPAVDSALLLIETPDGWGSGFLYGDTRTVVTNRHLFTGMAPGALLRLRPVRTHAGGFTGVGEPVQGALRFQHRDFDLAVVELVRPLEGGRPLELAPGAGTGLVPRGVSIWVHGFPSTGAPLVSRGILAGHYRDLSDGDLYYLTDAAMAPGSSGGPVTDGAGRLLGVSTALYDGGEDLGFDWGFILPASYVVDCFPGGPGLAGLPRPFPLEDWQARIRAAGGRGSPLPTLSAALEEVDRLAASDGEAARHSARLLETAAEVWRVREVEDLTAFYDVLFELVTLRGRREVIAGWEGRAGSAEALLPWIQAAETVQKRVEEAVVEAGLSGRISVEEAMATVLDRVRWRLEEDRLRLPEAGARIAAFLKDPRAGYGSSDRQDLVEDLVLAARLLHTWELAHGMVEEFPAELRRSRPAWQARIRLGEGLRKTQEAWDRLPAPVRDLLEPVREGTALLQDALQGTPGSSPAASADLLTSVWESMGLVRSGHEVFSLAGGEVREFRIPMVASDFPFHVLAWSGEGLDLDLFVMDPAGRTAGQDDLPDGIPVVTTFSGPTGLWLIRVVNASRRSGRVTLEVWEN